MYMVFLQDLKSAYEQKVKVLSVALEQAKK